MIYVFAITSFFLPVCIGLLLIRKQILKIGFSDLASFGTYLQGVAALMLIPIGLISGNDILNGIKDLKKSIEDSQVFLIRAEQSIGKIEAALKEINDKVTTLTIKAPPKLDSSNGANVGKSNDKKVLLWEKSLEAVPEVKTENSFVYIPNKKKVAKELASMTDSFSQAKRLKSAIQLNKDNLAPGTVLDSEVRVRDNDDFELIINKTISP